MYVLHVAVIEYLGSEGGWEKEMVIRNRVNGRQP